MRRVDSKIVSLKSSDGKILKVEEAVAAQSEIIKNAVEERRDENDVIPIPEVDIKTLAKVVSFCRKHAGREDEEDEKAINDLRKWDAKFIDLDQAFLYDLLMAANYLNIPTLLDLAVGRVADLVRGKTAEQIRKKFKIDNDFTPDEEEEMRKKNAWAFQH